jgi:hypothetical protein
VPLPAWNGNGLLPPGIQRASLDDIYERCVGDAPHSPWRETVFAALKTYFAVLQHRGLVPAGTAWIDGGFMTQKAAGPFDVDVVLHPTHWSRLNSLTDKEEAALFGPDAAGRDRRFAGLVVHAAYTACSRGSRCLPLPPR